MRGPSQIHGWGETTPHCADSSPIPASIIPIAVASQLAFQLPVNYCDAIVPSSANGRRSAMRHPLSVAAWFAMALALARLAAPQTPADQTTPEALTAQYGQAMQARDWPHALAAAQQLVDRRATAENLLLLANAQLYAANATGEEEASLATYDRALAAADQEKPAEGQPDAAWKEELSKIYLGKGNALLKLRRNADAIDAYNRSAERSSNPGLATSTSARCSTTLAT
jgi:tetratricopeptide (TPR) repeat protein